MTLRDCIRKARRLLAGDVRDAVYRSPMCPSRAIDLDLSEPIDRTADYPMAKGARRCPE